MSGQSIPEQLRKSLQRHVEEADLHEDEELTQLMGKLSDLSAKVAGKYSMCLSSLIHLLLYFRPGSRTEFSHLSLSQCDSTRRGARPLLSYTCHFSSY